MTELRKRLTERGRENSEQIEQRLETAKWEFTKTPLYNHIFVNDSLDDCVKEVEDVIRDKAHKRALVDKLLAE